MKINHKQNTVMPKKLLILSSNPNGDGQSRHDEQIRDIEEGIRLSKYRDKFQIIMKVAVTSRGIRRAMFDSEPEIIHFCGHGTEDGLILEDPTGNPALASSDGLAGLIKLFNEMECVVLNAGFSEPHLTEISEHVKYVIGMKKDLPTKAAIEFSIGFYDALGAEKGVKKAFEFGCNAIQMNGYKEYMFPILKVNENLNLRNTKRTKFIMKKVSNAISKFLKISLIVLVALIISFPLVKIIKALFKILE